MRRVSCVASGAERPMRRVPCAEAGAERPNGLAVTIATGFNPWKAICLAKRDRGASAAADATPEPPATCTALKPTLSGGESLSDSGVASARAETGRGTRLGMGGIDRGLTTRILHDPHPAVGAWFRHWRFRLGVIHAWTLGVLTGWRRWRRSGRLQVRAERSACVAIGKVGRE